MFWLHSGCRLSLLVLKLHNADSSCYRAKIQTITHFPPLPEFQNLWPVLHFFTSAVCVFSFASALNQIIDRSLFWCVAVDDPIVWQRDCLRMCPEHVHFRSSKLESIFMAFRLAFRSSLFSNIRPSTLFFQRSFLPVAFYSFAIWASPLIRFPPCPRSASLCRRFVPWFRASKLRHFFDASGFFPVSGVKAFVRIHLYVFSQYGYQVNDSTKNTFPNCFFFKVLPSKHRHARYPAFVRINCRTRDF